MRSHPRRLRSRRLGAMALAAGIVLAGCSDSSDGTEAGSPTSDSAGVGASGEGSQVLPVDDNPISNDSTVEALEIDSVLVENNVDPSTGDDAPDHLEIALSNSGSTELAGFEVFYTFTDRTDDASESYYAELPDSFTIPAGGSRVAHFDDTGERDHFPVNAYSLYYSSVNELDVDMVVSADGAAVQEATVRKDAGGEENPDE